MGPLFLDSAVTRPSTKPNDTVLLLGGEDDGIVVDLDAPQVCEIRPSEKALHPGEQQIITSIATLAFFESVFAETAADRAAAKSALNTALNEELMSTSLLHSYLAEFVR